MGDIIYVRMKKNYRVYQNDAIILKDIAFITGDPDLCKTLEKTFIYQITDKDNQVSVIDGFLVIEQLLNLYPNTEFQLLGPTQTIVTIQKKKKQAPVLLVGLIWILLFIGSSMAIMNFHYDVAMQEVQQKLHYLLTGKQSAYPLWMQIPYSIGLGVGMILFFNHLFKKRFNDEPSPLEIELFKYQQDLDTYVSYYDNTLNTDDSKTN